jgi:hypothetical protein
MTVIKNAVAVFTIRRREIPSTGDKDYCFWVIWFVWDSRSLLQRVEFEKTPVWQTVSVSFLESASCMRARIIRAEAASSQNGTYKVPLVRGCCPRCPNLDEPQLGSVYCVPSFSQSFWTSLNRCGTIETKQKCSSIPPSDWHSSWATAMSSQIHCKTEMLC